MKKTKVPKWIGDDRRIKIFFKNIAIDKLQYAATNCNYSRLALAVINCVIVDAFEWDVISQARSYILDETEYKVTKYYNSDIHAKAKRYLTSKTAGFRFWCNVVGIDALYAEKIISDALQKYQKYLLEINKIYPVYKQRLQDKFTLWQSRDISEKGIVTRFKSGRIRYKDFQTIEEPEAALRIKIINNIIKGDKNVPKSTTTQS